MRMMHTMIRVRDLDASLKFYCELLDMKLLRKDDFPEGKFTLAFVGYGDVKDSTVLELTHNWDVKNYEHGDAYGREALIHVGLHTVSSAPMRGGSRSRFAGLVDAIDLTHRDGSDPCHGDASDGTPGGHELPARSGRW